MRIEKIQIGKIAKVISGFAFKSKDFQSNGIPIIKIKNIKDENVVLEESDCVDSSIEVPIRFHLANGDILISLTGSHITLPSSVVGRVAKYRHETNSYLNQRAGKFINIDNKKCFKNYLFYFLLQKETTTRIALKAQGAANQANISPGDVEGVEINLPPLPTQRKIAGILSAYDDLIENNLKRIKLLEEAAQVSYKLLAKSEKLEELKLNQVVQLLKRGISPKYVAEDGIVVLNQKCIRNHIVSFRDSRLTDSEKNPSEERMLQKFDTLINSTGMGTLGRIAMNIQDEIPITVDSHITIARAKKNITPIFLCQSLFEKENMIEGMGEGSTNQTELSARKLGEEVKISIPPRKPMLEYEKKAVNIFTLIHNLQKQNSKLREARDILLPRLMNGEIEV